jgi:hypothetical protein
VLNAFALAIVADAGGGYPGVRGHEPDIDAGAKISPAGSSLHERTAHSGTKGRGVSERDFFEEDWQHSYWGSNYERLASVKKKYDPTGLFFAHNGIGSDQWSADGFTRH